MATINQLVEQTSAQSRSEFEKLGSAYTIVGAGGDINLWVNGYIKMLREAGVLLNDDVELEWVTWCGSMINSAFALEGDNEFQDDLTFLAFVTDSTKLNIGKLAMFRLAHRDVWLDDLIANSVR